MAACSRPSAWAAARPNPRIARRSSRARVAPSAGSATPAMTSAASSRATHPDYLIEHRIGGGGMGEVYLRPATVAPPPGRHQDDGPDRRRQRAGQGVLPARDGGAQGPADAQRRVPSEHRRLLRHLRDRWPVPARHGVRRRQERAGVGREPRDAAADPGGGADRPAVALGARLRALQGVRPPRRQAVEPAGDRPAPAAAGQALRLRPGQELPREPRVSPR